MRFITVSDTGMGIPEAEIGKIFDLFYTSKKPEEGTGLGLWMTFELVKRNKGDIRWKARSAKVRLLRWFSGGFMKKSILIIEDEKIMRVSLTDMLKAEGYTVLAAPDGATGHCSPRLW
jgi:hypothetical protein